MIRARLTVNVPRSWMAELWDRYRAKVRVIDRKPVGRHGVRDLVEILAKDATPEEVIEAIRRNAFVQRASLQSTKAGKALASVTTKCLACSALAASSCFLVRATTQESGSLVWDLVAEDRDAVKGLVGSLGEAGVAATLDKLSEASDEDALTHRQEEILRAAFERGYFDYPKNIGVRELASMFHVSTSTVSEILRKGQKKVLREYFGGKRGG
ncbi:MAG TPA: helix-turn-helix domain-containing protein [Thermoplasmata archaeon]